MRQKIPEGYQLDPPEYGSIESYTGLLERDPTIPKPDVTLGSKTPRLVKIKPMADLSRPEDFPEEVKAIIEASRPPKGLRGVLERAGLSF